MKPVVLIVEDSAVTRKFLMLAVRSKGYEVLTAHDGMEALEKLARGKVDMVITDLNMPNMDGFELTQTIRKQYTPREMPIIILSSLQNDQEREKGMSLGANAYLNKPFNTALIQKEIEKHLIRKESE
jgi:DNA-binding response OmpR family regulator